MWRVGRNLYCRARGEIANNLATNGETYVQSCVLHGASTLTDKHVTLFDVGANLGEWTRALLHQCPDADCQDLRLYLFEPVPTTFARLQDNIAHLDQKDHARCFPLALSNKTGEAEMVILSESGGSNSLQFDASLAANALGRVKIRMNTLCNFCLEESIDHIHLLKCDTEGNDANVLEGAAAFLREERIDVVQFEYNHRWVYARRFLKDIFDLTDDLPYHVARIMPDHIEVFNGWHFELERFFEANYLIVHDRALPWFNSHMGQFDGSNVYV